MKLTTQIKALLEKKETISLDGKDYQLNVQKGIEALVQYEFDNPDMGNMDDFKDDKQRLLRLKKDMKGMDVDTVKEQIEMYVGEEEINIKDLIKNKVIK